MMQMEPWAQEMLDVLVTVPSARHLVDALAVPGGGIGLLSMEQSKDICAAFTVAKFFVVPVHPDAFMIWSRDGEARYLWIDFDDDDIDAPADEGCIYFCDEEFQ